MLPNPLRDRFGFTAHLEFYSDAELEQVLSRAASLLGLDMERGALAEIAGRCRGTPRIANRLLRRVRDYSLVHEKNGLEAVHAALDLYEVDALGLDPIHAILRLEIEKAHRPRVVRFLRIGGSTVEDPNLAHSIVVYFSMILAIFVFSWLLLITFEPNSTWGESETQSTLDEKLLDSASAVAATLNNIGPGLGVVGATQNYAGFSQGAKLLFVWLMMLGRVEVFSVLVLIFPAFWRRV